MGNFRVITIGYLKNTSTKNELRNDQLNAIENIVEYIVLTTEDIVLNYL